MTLGKLGIAILLQAVQPPPAPTPSVPATRSVLPVLGFPAPGVDDSAAYRGYQTRFYRDSKENAVQIYLEPRGSRVVQVWADAANESLGFTVRDGQGRAARLAWGAEAAEVADSGPTRTLEYRLTAESPQVTLGWFVLGSMRVERDFQYDRRHLRPFTAPPFRVAEESLLVASLARLPAGERRRELALLDATSLAQLRSRLEPTLATSASDTLVTVRVARPSLDGRTHLWLELRVDPRKAAARVTGRSVSIRARSGTSVSFAVRVATDAAALTPLPRDQIFTRPFLDFLAAAHKASDNVLRAGPAPRGADSAIVARYRRLEREVRAVELLSTEEKLMAGLPNFATYFGRDMLMTALMMRPIWSPVMSEHVIASVLRKLGPAGDVSHEEALGGQAIREHATEYGDLIAEYRRVSPRGGAADSILERAQDVLRDLAATRENYYMRDDEFQLPVLVADYLSDPDVPVDRKRGFLLDTTNARSSRLALLLGEMALVATETQPYAREPVATNLVGFVKRDATHWRSASWRDSDAGYANGRFAMDINAIWAPHALESIATILGALPGLGFTRESLDSIAPAIARSPLGEYVRDSASLRRAIGTWQGARRHFRVKLSRPEIEARIRAKLAWLQAGERRYWQKAMADQGEVRDTLDFLALSLDSAGHPIPIVNTDPATELILENLTAAIARGRLTPDTVLAELEPFLRPYPVGLFVSGLGPLVANDAYASRRVWEGFAKDAYHSPRVVWGREVYLLLLGLANQIGAAYDASGRLANPALALYVRSLGDALQRTLVAVKASGLEHNELWSYRIVDGRLLPSRYGTSSDVQLWSTTDLAVQFVLARLPQP